MNDLGTEYTDKQTKKLEKRLKSVYTQAGQDIKEKMDDFNEKFKVKDAIHRQELKDGKITQEEYDNWRKGQIFQGERWKAKQEQIARTLANANRTALGMVNNERNGVFAFNSNYQAYDLEHSAGVNFGFDLYDSATVANLIKNEPTLLPKKVLDPAKDIPWNMKNISNQVTLGIIQGESLDKIASRIAKETGSTNYKAMVRSARTAMTGAQNAGRYVRLRDAKSMGINVVKEWMATLDGRTRDSHRDMDGEQIKITGRGSAKFSNGCRYPGDPEGPPREVYNCRCTLVGDVTDYPSEYQRYDNIDGFPVRNMNYRDWQKAKFGKTHRSPADFVWNKWYTGTPNRDYGKADTSDALKEILDGKPNSLSNYLDANGNLSPERAALHKQIIDNYLAGKTPEEKMAIMTMMGGGPASGKSSVIKSGLYQLPNPAHSVTVDPDEIKQYLPGYLRMSKTSDKAASFYHEESSMLAKQLANTCFTENFNVTYDGTGDGSINSVLKKLNGAKEHGYQVNGMYVTVDIDEALKRNQSRYDHAVAKGESPRLVPDEYVIDCHKKVTRISMEVSDQFDNIELYDNNGKSGETKLIGRGGNGTKLRAVKGEEKAFKKFLEKAK